MEPLQKIFNFLSNLIYVYKKIFKAILESLIQSLQRLNLFFLFLLVIKEENLRKRLDNYLQNLKNSINTVLKFFLYSWNFLLLNRDMWMLPNTFDSTNIYSLIGIFKSKTSTLQSRPCEMLLIHPIFIVWLEFLYPKLLCFFTVFRPKQPWF